MSRRSRPVSPVPRRGVAGALGLAPGAPHLVAADAGAALAPAAAVPARADLVGGGQEPAGDAASPGRDLREVAISHDARRGGLIGGRAAEVELRPGMVHVGRAGRAGSRSVRRVALAAAVSVGLGLAAAPSASANLIGDAKDPVGDATDPSPARDLVGAGMAYDRRRGALVGAVALRGAPSGDTGGFLTLFAGTRTPAGCNGYPAIGFATTTSESSARWTVLRGGPTPDPTFPAEKRGGRDAVQRFEIVDPRLKSHRPDCVIATLTEPGNVQNVWDTVEFGLRPVPVLAARLRGVPSRLAAGTSRRVRVTVRNEGDAPTRSGRLRVAGVRGLRATPSSSRVPAIPAGGSRTVSFRVALTSRARSSTPLRVSVTAGDQTVRTEGRIVLRRPKASGGGSGGGGGTRTCTRYAPDPFGDTGGSLVLVPC